VHKQTSSRQKLLLIESLVHGHGGSGQNILIVQVRYHADDAPGRGCEYRDHFQDRVGPKQMMIQHLAFGKHPLRDALAHNRHRLAAGAVRIIEIASFDKGQAERGEKPGCNDANHGAPSFFARRWNVPIG